MNIIEEYKIWHHRRKIRPQLILDNKKQCDNICETKGGVRTNKVLVLKTDMCGCLIDNHLELVEME